jgi:hypothetical protein
MGHSTFSVQQETPFAELTQKHGIIQTIVEEK